MRRLYFDKLTLMSSSEKRGFVLPFHRKATTLKGENDVGKSSLLKSLLKTFGTQPHKETERWTKANVTSLVDFTVDDTRYSLLKSRNTFSLFDGNGDLLDAFTSVTNELSPYLANLFSFHLALSSKGSSSTQATPAFLFLPFYADQDRSWVASLESFERLAQFSNYRRDVVWFHTGIRPNDFYLAKAMKMEAERKQEEEKASRDVIQHAIRRVDSLFKQNDFALKIEDFQEEIESLIQESRKLATRETTLKEQIVALRNMQLAVDSQLSIVLRAATELDKDFDYAASTLGDEVECPTCGAHYENSVAERFAIAKDEDKCRELIESLQEEKRRLRAEYDQALSEATRVQAELQEIDDLLASRKGEVGLEEILQSEGKREVRKALLEDVKRANLRIGELDQQITDAARQMKDASDTKRSRQIKDFYQERMSEFLEELAVSVEPGSYEKIDCRIKESGSDGPRALLAYQFAILHTIHRFSTSTFCPIVVDSPNQQDQDEENWNRIRDFIRQRQPDNSQLILALVDDGGTDFGGTVVEFDAKYHVLREDQYEEAASRLRPLIDVSIAYRMSS